MRRPRRRNRARPTMPRRLDDPAAARRDLRWLVAALVILLVIVGLATPFLGRATVRLFKGFFDQFLFPGGALPRTSIALLDSMR